MTLGVGAHVSAGGLPPSLLPTVVLTAVFAMFCWALSSRRWTARPLVAVFLLAQIGTHTVSMAEHPQATMGWTAMVPAHLLAAALLVLVVTHGESALVQLVDHLALRCLGLRVLPAPRRVSAPIPAPVVSRLTGLFSQPVRGRAPPQGFLLPAS